MRHLSPILKSALNPWITLIHSYIISHLNQGGFIIYKHFQQKFFFSRAFQAPLKYKIKFQGYSRTSRSSWRTLDQTCQDRLLLWMTKIWKMWLFSFHAQFHFHISSYPFNHHLLYKHFIFVIPNFFLNWSSSLICPTLRPTANR